MQDLNVSRSQIGGENGKKREKEVGAGVEPEYVESIREGGDGNQNGPNGGQRERVKSNERQHGGKTRRSGSSVNLIQFADESLDVAWSEWGRRAQS